MFAKFLLTLLLSLSAFLFASCGDTPSNNNSNSEDAPINADDEIKNNDDEDKSGDKGENVPSGGSNDDDGEDKDKGEDISSGGSMEDEKSKEDDPIKEDKPILEFTNSYLTIDGYSGNLYTVVYYVPSASTLANTTFSISATAAINANSLYAPSFFKALYIDEEVYTDPNFSDIVASLQRNDAILREPVELSIDADAFNSVEAKAFFLTNSSVPTTKTFYVHKNGANNNYSTVTATLKHTSANAYFYVDNSVSSSVDLESLKLVASKFDENFDNFTRAYAKPIDIDSNGGVIFLITNLSDQNLMGFFLTSDQLPTIVTINGGKSKSNAADMLYLNSKYFTSTYLKDKNNSEKNIDHAIALLFHELQHMVLHQYKSGLTEGTNVSTAFSTQQSLTDYLSRYNNAMAFTTWINEGLSMLSEYVSGFALAHIDYVRMFFLERMHYPIRNNGNNITVNGSNAAIEYGYNLLFLQYLYERFGATIIKRIYETTQTTEDGIFKYATKSENNPEGISFEELYSDFAKMLLASGRGATTNPKYNIKAFNYTNGTAGYKKTGFNLKDEINFAISYHGGLMNLAGGNSIPKDNSMLITSTSLSSKSISPYSFYITRWNKKLGQIKLNQSVSGLKGAYIISDN